MGKICQVCEKGMMSGHKVSHSNRKSNRTWAPNIQKVRVMKNGGARRMNVCTRCLRSGKVLRALPSLPHQDAQA
ncbi:MAG: 50S ribosomal protein L28 [Clostridiales bacterium]|nr:50S ribosomal protein L28 [Clostridiales bacterium]